MVTPRIGSIFYGCEVLVPSSEEPTNTHWQGLVNERGQARVTADLKTDQLLRVQREGRPLVLTVPGDTTVDIYVTPLEEGLGYEIAPSGTAIDQRLLQRCGYLPGRKNGGAAATPGERDAMIAAVEAALPGEQSEVLRAWIQRLWPDMADAVRRKVHAALGNTRWLAMQVPQLKAYAKAVVHGELLTGVLHESGRLALTSHATVPPLYRRVFAGLMGEVVARNGAGSGLVILAPNAPACATYRAGLHDKTAVLCRMVDSLPGDTVLMSMLPGPDIGATQLTAHADAIQRDAATVVETLQLMAGHQGLHGTFRASPVKRIVYGDCTELASHRNAAGVREWTLPAEGLTVRPAAKGNQLIAVRQHEGAILQLPSDAAVDLYLDTTFHFDPAIHLYPHRPTAEQTAFSTYLETTHQCALPLTAPEAAAARARQVYPTYALHVAFRGSNVGPTVDVATEVSPATGTLGLMQGGLDCKPSELHLNCPGIKNTAGLYPEFNADRPDAVNLLGFMVGLDINVWRMEDLQLFAGPELVTTFFTRHNGSGFLGMFDANARIGLRSDWLNLDTLLFLPGFAIGAGLSVDWGLKTVGGNVFTELDLLRYAGEKWFLELFLRFEWHRTQKSDEFTRADGRTVTQDTTVTLNNFAFGSMTADHNSVLFGVRIGCPLGDPPPVPDTKPDTFVVLKGELLYTPYLEFAPGMPSDAWMQEILALQDVRDILALPLFASPLHDKVDIALDAFQQVAAQIRGVPEGYKIQIICAVDTQYTAGRNTAQRLQRGENGARLARHLLTKLGVPAERLVIMPWSTADARGELAAFKGPQIDRLPIRDGILLFAVLKPVVY